MRAQFDLASRWQRDDLQERKDLASRWQQYSEHRSSQGWSEATLTKYDNPKRKHSVGNLWWNKGLPPRQASLSLKRGCTHMNKLYENLKQHPLVVGSDGTIKLIILDGKVNARSKAEQHESVYNVKLTTTLGFNLTVGYSRHKDPESLESTHAWVAFGDQCTEQWQRELGVNFLLNIVGYKAYFPTSPTSVKDFPTSSTSRWQVKDKDKGSTHPTPPPPAALTSGSSSSAPPPPAATPCPQPLAGLAAPTPTQVADGLPEAGASASCWSQPLAGGSIASSAAPKRATNWHDATEEDEAEEQLAAGAQRDAAPAETQPLAGTAPAPQTKPLTGLPLQAPPQLVHGGPEANFDDDEDDDDYEGLETREAVGEQSIEEEAAQGKRQHQGEDSEAEENAFKLKVAAVVRKTAEQRRFGRTSFNLFRPAVGSAGRCWTCKFTSMPFGWAKGSGSH